MKKEFVVDLKDAKSESDVFGTFNSTFEAVLKYYQWDIQSWDGLDDFLWGLIQPGDGSEGDDVIYKGIDMIEVSVVNSSHLDSVHADRIKNADRSILQGIRDSFEHIKSEQKNRTEPDDSPVFRNSTFAVVS